MRDAPPTPSQSPVGRGPVPTTSRHVCRAGAAAGASPNRLPTGTHPRVLGTLQHPRPPHRPLAPWLSPGEDQAGVGVSAAKCHGGQSLGCPASLVSRRLACCTEPSPAAPHHSTASLAQGTGRLPRALHGCVSVPRTHPQESGPQLLPGRLERSLSDTEPLRESGWGPSGWTQHVSVAHHPPPHVPWHVPSTRPLPHRRTQRIEVLSLTRSPLGPRNPSGPLSPLSP